MRGTDDAVGFGCVRREIVPHTALGRWGIGTQLPVRIDRDDPERFEVLWDALPLPGARASVVDDLAVLADLAAKGLLSTDEWERAKALYLGKPPDRRQADSALLADLHRLHEEGVLSESEFNTKKWEILSRT